MVPDRLTIRKLGLRGPPMRTWTFRTHLAGTWSRVLKPSAKAKRVLRRSRSARLFVLVEAVRSDGTRGRSVERVVALRR